MLPFEYIVAIDIYRDPEMDLQIPQSHLAFRMPAGFTRRLNAMEHSEFFTRPQAPAFSSFTARIRASEKLDERYLRLMARRLSSPASRACTERYRYRKFKGISLPTNSMRPIDRRWFARFSSRVLNPKPIGSPCFSNRSFSRWIAATGFLARAYPPHIVVATPPPPRPRIPVIAPV